MQGESVNIEQADLLHFAAEREKIRALKEAGKPAPWTDDQVLQRYRFCNIRRRDDRVSRWLLQNAYPHLEEDADAWFVAAIMRLINWPPTLAHLLEKGAVTDDADDFYPGEFEAQLEEYHQAHPDKTYTGAYMLYAGGRQAQFKGVVKSHFIAHHLLTDLARRGSDIREAVKKGTVRDTVNALRQSFGISTFMAGQIAADLTYLPWLEKAPDLHTYAPQGPGSLRGLNRLKRLPLGHLWDQEDFNTELQAVLKLLPSGYGLTLHDVQNVLCEFDKYERTRRGEGKPRSTYIAETAYHVAEEVPGPEADPPAGPGPG